MGTGLERISELTAPPVVGRFYLVPTVLHHWDGSTKAKPWPVFLPKHSDARFFNFEREHYHVDPRFLSARAWANTEDRGWMYSRQDAALARCQAQPVSRWWGGVGDRPMPGVVWRKLQCRRLTIDYQHGASPQVGELRAHYAGQQCRRNRAGWVCPHQNWPMGSLEPDADGVLTCPLHGLRVRASDGVVLAQAEARSDV